jgi:DNA-binding transcriptional LysR family regulator
VIEDVRSGAADFGISYLDGLPDSLVAVPLGREEFTVVLPRNHALARKASIALSELKDLPLVSLTEDSRTRRLIDTAAASARLALKHVVVVSQFTTMLGFVRAGVGLAIALKALPLRGRPLVRDLGIVALGEREPTVAASALIALIQQSWKADRD